MANFYYHLSLIGVQSMGDQCRISWNLVEASSIGVGSKFEV